jgi:hypothetical protein
MKGLFLVFSVFLGCVRGWILPSKTRVSVKGLSDGGNAAFCAGENKAAALFLNNEGAEAESSSAAATGEVELTPEELFLVERLVERADVSDTDLKQVVLEDLPTMPAGLIIKLRQSLTDANQAVRQVAQQVNAIMDDSLSEAKETVKELLNAGEIRKLDALIGKASRAGKLDAAFFNVLAVNLQDALATERSQPPPEPVGDEPPVATKAQILRHIYTRCQEEMEKSLPPGSALLNKLLRTEQAAIRKNLYEHYLTPQKQTIKSPDGKEIKLEGVTPVLVPLTDFVRAIDKAVLQIRTVENAGATDRESAAMMVEGCRQVAKEALSVVGDSYGRDSDEVKLMQDELQPVFRPQSRDSPYIRGEQSAAH